MIPLLTSAITLLAVWLSGRNVRLSWKVSLVNQAVWLVFIITNRAWGFLPLTVALSGMFADHLWRTRGAAGPRLTTTTPSSASPNHDGCGRLGRGQGGPVQIDRHRRLQNAILRPTGSRRCRGLRPSPCA